MEQRDARTTAAGKPGRSLSVAPTMLLRGEPSFPSSKYYTLRYLLAATLAEGESQILFPALSEDSEALFRGCRALGAQLDWLGGPGERLQVRGVGRPRAAGAVTINVGNAGAVLRLLLGVAAWLPQVTFVTDQPQSLGRRPNRELLQALEALGVRVEAQGPEGYLPITLYGGQPHGGRVMVSGARSSQYVSALLFLAPLLAEPLTIEVVDGLTSQVMVQLTLKVLRQAGIVIEHDAALRRFLVPAPQAYRAGTYVVPGDYPSAAALLAACAAMPDPASELRLGRLPAGEEDGEALVAALLALGCDLRREGETLYVRGGRPLRGLELDGSRMIDCIPVLVALACFAEGRTVFYNVENLHYKESDRINDLCAELQRAGCRVTPLPDAIVVEGQPEGVEGGVWVDGHSDHRLLQALTIVGMRSRRGLSLRGVEHVAKSFPHFFSELQRLGAVVSPALSW
ncbi:3-phosphoshikimate 1-carboxyvinyltransferase [Thermogemmatispora onikobensis]|uniref:3-phosphoshikimate 1-carboxyvinyltransferase n=1 Tax=Thermogemmatispora onikobensis TaxID=732234 RepID=UPI000852C656|nr:3-phosphoshikimate 1-carboxyvinyltransferase [Thermogemmatispora onikobensis]